MPFIRLPGVRGKIYVPDEGDAPSKKHPCPDCKKCGQCSDARCRVCLNRHCCRRRSPETDGME